ncbi:uncharacterized protein N7498_008516 [Penicillium cinerascens]|uniref:Arsenite methyltransferase n=1 Tax=Penicillium cinerascens TaxID=70096 RepID=A0A9W9JDZ5_9EURO|nr:uncharacterized protein N7498_008516 [Penicillium cinerascens]KAJ5195078.1 hypothetical protein N7498_008516 [Penicillium cinerascens]
MDSSTVYSIVRTHYGDLATRPSKLEVSHEKIAKVFGYEPSELHSIPQDANLGVGCGNPPALTKLRKGETVVDLGSGGALDVILAARKVGIQGRAIGVDMTRSMVDLAQRNAEEAAIPLPDSTANCVISNSVVNLVPTAEKSCVFHEMFRLLVSGGRVAISDLLAKKDLPRGLASDMALYLGCIAGASRVYEYEEYLRDAGFKDILIVDTDKDLKVYKDLAESQSGDSVG